MDSSVTYLVAGDRAITMEFGNEISIEINRRIRQTAERIPREIPGIIELIPTYRSITILYDPEKISYSNLVAALQAMELSEPERCEERVRLIEIPTLYGGEYGPDLAHVAEHAGLSEEEVVSIHTGTDYLVYMLGFLPGFTYLGGMDERIATPRLASPRLKIPAGSVGIAGSQTGIYPSESPGGWQLIGRTPVSLFTPEKDPPVFVEAGDYMRFRAVDETTYQDILRSVQEGTYPVTVQEVKAGELHG